MNIFEKLQHIQCELKAPKKLFNSFGKYNYRNAEGILEALKPYLEKYKCTVIIHDGLEEKAGRLFIYANAIIYDCEAGHTDEMDLQSSLGSMAYAELDEHRGMSADQATGCASSYARKYALNALFLLDDTKDADSDEHHIETENKQARNAGAPISPKQLGKIKVEIGRTGVDVNKILERFKVADLEALSSEQASQAISILIKTADKAN